MLIFSTKQIQEIFDIISNFHAIFIATNVGVDVLSDDEIKTLKKFGIDLTNLPQTFIDQAFKFGLISTALQNDKVEKMDYKQFKSFLKSGRFLPLSKEEELALLQAKQQAYGDIKGLGNKIIQQVNQSIIQISKQQEIAVRGQIQEKTENMITERQSLQEFSSELGHLTKDWARDFDRIADYIMHSVYQQGRAQNLLKTYGDDVEVYFTVYEKACKHCVRVYLTGDVGSEPIVFKLVDVIKNGSNIGRKSDAWLPSVDPLHPWCRCTLTVKPENTKWSEEKQMFVLVKNNYGVKRKSKITVTITKA